MLMGDSSVVKIESAASVDTRGFVVVADVVALAKAAGVVCSSCWLLVFDNIETIDLLLICVFVLVTSRARWVLRTPWIGVWKADVDDIKETTAATTASVADNILLAAIMIFNWDLDNDDSKASFAG